MLLLCLVVGLSLSPYCFLFLLGSLRRQDPKLFESARLLRSKAGVGNKLSIMQVRLLLPAIIASIWFIALDSFGDLGASVVLGQDTLMALIYDTWIGLHSFNAALALALSS
jgi:ABC-type Fe3+ transport system permease subunit